MKKILYITHLSGKRVNRFWLSSLAAAHQLGYEFHLACNMKGAEQPLFNDECDKLGIITHHIDFNRNPLSFENVKAYKELLYLLKTEHFDVVHCNTPVGGLIGRLCAHRANVPYVIYQAHGFHFWRGAPLKNWIFYYPVEKFLAKYTDLLLTINSEDYNISKKFPAKDIKYVHGVGIDIHKFSPDASKREAQRIKLGLSNEDIMILSVGELIPRKNHIEVIKAIEKLSDKKIHYFICGTGVMETQLNKVIKSKHLENNVHLLGYRTDVNNLYRATDIFAFMSYQEGLPVAVMEAMASGNVVVCSNIRGNNDLISNKQNGFIADFDPISLSKVLNQVIYLENNEKKKINNIRLAAQEKIKRFDFDIVKKELVEAYKENQ